MAYFRRNRWSSTYNTNASSNANSARPKPAHLSDPTIPLRLQALIANPKVDQWTVSFCTSLLGGFNRFRGLTESQYKIFLAKEAQFSAASMAAAVTWETDFSADPEKTQNFNIAVSYYRKTGYFGRIIDAVNSNPNYIPSQQEYTKITSNKYAQSAIAEVKSGFKFEPGEFVTARAGRLRWYGDSRIAMVVENSNEWIRSVKGGRGVKILVFGTENPIFVTECDIKRATKADLK